MSDPVLVLLAGPNGAGKTTLFNTVLAAATALPFVNADLIAADRWPGDEERHGHDASIAAAAVRTKLIAARDSFATETVFSHPSKLDLIRDVRALGYRVQLHVVLIPVELSVARVAERVRNGGHSVPEATVRARYERLWPLIAAAVGRAHEATVYDNSRSHPAHRTVATFQGGQLVGTADWPAWTPTAMTSLTA